MKNLLIVLVLFSNYVFGQDLNFAWGEMGQVSYGTGKSSFVPLDTKSLQNIDAKTGSKAFVKPSIIAYQKGLRGFLITKNHMYYPVTQLTPERESTYLQEIDHLGKPKGSYKLIADDVYFTEKVMRPKDKYNTDCEGLVVNNAGEKILRLTTSGQVVQSNPEKFTVTVLDENLNKLWTKTEELSNYMAPECHLFDFILTNEGKVVLAAIIETKPKEKKGESVYSLKVFSVTKDKMQEIECPIDADKEVNTARLIEDADGKVIVSGLYKDKKNKLPQSNGTYIVKVDVGAGTVVSKFTYPLNETTYASAKISAKNMALGIGETEMTNLIQLPNGDYSLFLSFGGLGGGWAGPAYYFGTDNVTHASQYNCNNQLIIGYDKALKRTYETCIKNEFETGLLNYHPKALILGQNALLLYNKGTQSGKYALMAAVIDNTGKLVTDQQINIDGKGLQLDADFVRSLSDKGVVLDVRQENMVGVPSYTNFKECIVTNKSEPIGH